MKIRTDFVTNSSSSSFIIIRDDIPSKDELKEKLFEGVDKAWIDGKVYEVDGIVSYLLSSMEQPSNHYHKHGLQVLTEDIIDSCGYDGDDYIWSYSYQNKQYAYNSMYEYEAEFGKSPIYQREYREDVFHPCPTDEYKEWRKNVWLKKKIQEEFGDVLGKTCVVFSCSDNEDRIGSLCEHELDYENIAEKVIRISNH